MAGDMDRSVPSAKVLGVDRERLRSLFGWLNPGQSLVSGDSLAGNARLSPEEFAQLNFICQPFCDSCALPFERSEDHGLICAACAAHPPVWHQARSALVYDDITSRLILSLKRRGNRNGLSVFAEFLTSAAGDVLTTADLVIPVPIHSRRLAMRGFNQAGWLAAALKDKLSLPYDEFCIRRVKATPSQGHLNARQRRANVAGAFKLTKRGAERIAGKRIILLDDVYTTGATLTACARTLQRARPANLDVVTFARVVAPANPTI